jgi:GT2 family glycosyltransferase
MILKKKRILRRELCRPVRAVYCYGHFLRECVESVLSQSDVSVRVLIIDDASPDNTAEVAAALAGEDPGLCLKIAGHITETAVRIA